MAEGSETPEEPRQSERDLLAQRRARRAGEWESAPPTPGGPMPISSGSAQPSASHATDALLRRAEAAEATVQALETHLASLQQRVREAAEERGALAERLSAEQATVIEREHELRRVKQREYAEQQLRVESEDRRTHTERENHTEIDRLTRRLGASEHHARELAERLESAERELEDAEAAATAELAELRAAGERALQRRFSELERRTSEIARLVDTERSARERAEEQLAQMRAGYRQMERLVAELRGVMADLRAAAARGPRRREVDASAQDVHGGQREELADALAAAVERLRARAEASGLQPEELSDTAANRLTAPAEDVQAAVATRSSELAETPATSVLEPMPHKHTMSLLTRVRLRRKQRRERRAAAAEAPKIHAQ